MLNSIALIIVWFPADTASWKLNELLVAVGDSFFACGGDRLEKPPNADQGDTQVSNPRKSLEQEYLDYETKVRIAAPVVL